MGRLVGLLSGVLASALSRQVADEFKAWTPWLTKRLVDLSVSKLPSNLRERYQEEWSRHVEDTPGQVGKLSVAVFLLHAAAGIRTMIERRLLVVRFQMIRGRILISFIRLYRVLVPSKKWRQHVSAPLTLITFLDFWLTSFNLWMVAKLDGFLETELRRTLELKRRFLREDNHL